MSITLLQIINYYFQNFEAHSSKIWRATCLYNKSLSNRFHTTLKETHLAVLNIVNLIKGTVIQIEKALINDRLRVSKVSWKFYIPTIYNFAVIYPWNLVFS